MNSVKVTMLCLILVGLTSAGTYYWTKEQYPCQSNLEISSIRTAQLDSSAVQVDGQQFLQAAYHVEQGDPTLLDAAVLDIGLQLNAAVEESVSMTIEEKATMNELLQAHYQDISAEVRDAYLARIKEIPQQTVTQITSTQHTTHAEILAAALNATVCSFSSFVFIPMRIQLSLPTAVGASYALQSPCETLLNGPMQAIGKQIQQAGIIRDIEITTSRLSVQRESLLAELTTAEILIRVDETAAINREINLGGYQLLHWQGAKLEIRYAVLLKYGFDLAEGLVIERDDTNHILTVRLSEPKLLSTHLEPEVTTADDGGIPDLTNVHFRNVYEKAEADAIRLAEQGGIQSKARQNAEQVLALIFAPFLQQYHLKFDYNHV